jgi:hypothetical protein
MNQIVIRPHKYSQFSSKLEESHFYLITDLPNSFVIEKSDYYKSYKIIDYANNHLLDVIQQTEEPAHILVICPNHFISSVEQHRVGKRKLAIMAANSAPTSVSAISHFVQVLEVSDSQAQRRFADRFFDIGERSSALHIVDEQYDTSAWFDPYADEDYEWFEQGGPIDWGCQQIVPAGEISVLPMAHGEYSAERRLAINGEVSLKGFTIVHSGKVSFLPTDQARIYKELSVLEKHAAIAKIENGVITKLQATHPSVESAKSILESLFTVDSRYALIWELGFGINTNLELWPENTAMNEVYGGDSGVVHWGLGLTPFTQYHLDIICPGTKVLSDTGEILIGSTAQKLAKGSEAKMVRNTTVACPCTSY